MTEPMSEETGRLFLQLINDIERCQAEEEQEACIHCGKVWYKIHHKDGVCHACSSAGKPGRTTIEQRAVIKQTLLLSAFYTAIFICFCLLLF